MCFVYNILCACAPVFGRFLFVLLILCINVCVFPFTGWRSSPRTRSGSAALPIYRRLIPVITAHPSRWAGSATPRRLPLACLCPFPICCGIGGRVPFSVPCVPVLPGRWRKARCPLPVRPLWPVRCRARTPARRFLFRCRCLGPSYPAAPAPLPLVGSGSRFTLPWCGSTLPRCGTRPAGPGAARGRSRRIGGGSWPQRLFVRRLPLGAFRPCPSWYQVGGRGPFCPCPSFLLPGREKAHCPQGFPRPLTWRRSPLGRQHAARCASRLPASIGRQAPPRRFPRRVPLLPLWLGACRGRAPFAVSRCERWPVRGKAPCPLPAAPLWVSACRTVGRKHAAGCAGDGGRFPLCKRRCVCTIV